MFRWGYTDRRLVALAISGMVLAASVVVGLPQLGPPWVPMLVFLALWIGYLSIVNVGQTFYGFGWEMLLCEALFTVAFLGSNDQPPPITIVVAIWWLVFRLEFGAGMIKIRGGREWRDLTALMYHHETQPMPNPFSRQAHLLPKWFHRGEVLGNHFAQLIVPFFLFVPGPVGSAAATIVILTQLWLIVTGNFAWLNWITVVLAAAAISDPVWHAVIPAIPADLGTDTTTTPLWWVIVVLAASGLILVLSWWPIQNLFSRRQLMNASFNRYMLVNAYGAFGTVTKRRIEIVVAGTLDAAPDDDADWREYGFKGKPGDLRAAAAAVGAVPPAARLADVVPAARAHVGTLVRDVPRATAASGCPDAEAARARSVRRGRADLGACAGVPLPLRDASRAPRDGRPVGAHARGRGDRAGDAAVISVAPCTAWAGHAQAPGAMKGARIV